MKTKLLSVILPLFMAITLASCSTESSEETNSNEQLITDFNYTDTELELADLINDYRISHGLNPLEIINHVSYKSLEHNNYMINNNVVNHDGFSERAENIREVIGAVIVGENVAYNFSTPNSALYAWLQSSGHKANIEGNYTHFGISIAVDPNTGKKYFTNIFLRK